MREIFLYVNGQLVDRFRDARLKHLAEEYGLPVTGVQRRRNAHLGRYARVFLGKPPPRDLDDLAPAIADAPDGPPDLAPALHKGF